MYACTSRCFESAPGARAAMAPTPDPLAGERAAAPQEAPIWQQGGAPRPQQDATSQAAPPGAW